MNGRLVSLIGLVTLLSLAHTADHMIRDNLALGSPDLYGLAIVSALIYGAIGGGLWLYAKGKVGPRFWTFFALAGLALAWASHLSPFTPQNPAYIFNAHGGGIAGALAVAVLAGLVLALAASGVYAAWLWRRKPNPPLA